MGPMVLLLIVFCTSWAIIYVLMRLVCWIKKEYCQAENWLCKVFETFECASCREACMNHKRLIIRSALFAFVIAVVIVVTYCIR